jgi:hypothetical protein
MLGKEICLINNSERNGTLSSAAYNLAKLPGSHANTTLLLQDNGGYSFIIEMIDKNLYEFTICMYDSKETMNRHEYVLTCNKQSLRDLKNVIETLLK